MDMHTDNVLEHEK